MAINSIRERFLERYCPTYKYDYERDVITPNLNFFSDLMAEQAELAKKGGSKLTQEEIEEYSGKCDMSQMSGEEIKDFLNFLYDKGVVERPPYHCEHEIQVSPGNHAGPMVEGAEAEAKWGLNADLGPRDVVLIGCSCCFDEMYEELLEELLAEQAKAEVLRSMGRMV